MKKVNPAGYGLILTGTAGGAYQGSQMELLSYNGSDHKRNTNKVGNAVVGGLVGFGLTTLASNLIFKKGKIVPIERNAVSYNKWAKKFGRNYVPLPNKSNPINLVVIPKKAEQSFQFRNLEDVQDFNLLFPQSSFVNHHIENSLQYMNENDLPKLISTYPQASTSSLNKVKTSYIKSRKALSSFIDALEMYPGLTTNIEEKGMTRIQSMKDVKLYRTNFKNYEESQLIEKAKTYAIGYEEVKYFNITFPRNPYFNDVLTAVIPRCNDGELVDLIKSFPNASKIKEVKKAYVIKRDNIVTLLERNNKYQVFELPKRFTPSKIQMTKLLVNLLNNQRSEIGDIKTNTFIKEASKKSLARIYESTSKNSAAQNKFINMVNKNNWLTGSETYVRNAKRQIEKNERAAYLAENELDNITRYVAIADWEYESSDGKKLNGLDQILSSLTEMKNKQLFYKGKVKNYGAKSKKAKITVTLNMLEETISTFSNYKEKYQKTKDFYVEIPAGATADFMVMFEYKLKHKDEYNGIWGRNYFSNNVDRDNPIETSIDYFEGSIPSAQYSEYEKAKRLYQSRTRSTDSGSMYEYTSTTHKIITKENAYVAIDRLTDNAKSEGCINIYSGDYKNGYYASSIVPNSGRKESFSDADKDDFAGCFRKSDFPLMVEISYSNEDGEAVYTKVILEEFYDYSIRVNN